MYKNMLMCASLFCGLLSFATDDTTIKINKDAALRRWLSSGKSEELNWAYDDLNIAFQHYCDTHKNASLNDEGAIKAGQTFLAQLCEIPAQVAHEGLQSMRWQMISELEVRKELAKKTEERDYSLLINHVISTHNRTAHKHIAEYLINNPSKKTASLIPTYLQELSKKDIELLFDKAVRVAVQQSDGGLLATLMYEGTSKEVSNVVARIAEELCAKKNASSFAPVIDTFISTVIMTDITAKIMEPTSNKHVLLLQSLLSIANADLKTVGGMLFQNKDLMVLFTDAAEKLITYTIKKGGVPGYLYKPCVSWNRSFRVFFNSCFKKPFDEETRASLASHLFKKYESNPADWQRCSVFACCVATQCMFMNNKKDLATKALQRSIEDFARLFSMSLKGEIQEGGKKLINGLYMAVYKNKEDKKLFSEQLLNTNELVLLVSCNAKGLSDYLMSVKRFKALPLKPCVYGEVADVIMASLGGTLKKSAFIDRLKTVAQSDSPAATPALRVLMHFDLCESIEEEKECAGKLYKIYQKEGNKGLLSEVEECVKGHIIQGIHEGTIRIRQGIEDSYKILFADFRSGKATDMQLTELDRLERCCKEDPVLQALKVSRWACGYGSDELALSKMIVSCAQARQLGAIAPNDKWHAYITPHSAQIFWKEAWICAEKAETTHTQGDFDIIAYAVYINKTKSFDEKMALLQKAVGKHPFCSLLYVQNALQQVNNTFERMPWDERKRCYQALHYAVIQGQRSQKLAESLDGVTQQKAMTLLDNNILYGDLGSAIVHGSCYNDSNIDVGAGYIAVHPFKIMMNALVLDTPIDNYIALAEDLKVLPLLENEAKKHNSVALCALFRLYFTKLYDVVTSSDAEKNLAFIERIMNYGCTYIFNDKTPQKGLVKQHLMSLINKMIEKQCDIVFFKDLKNTVEKL